MSFKFEQINWDFPDSNKSDSINAIHPYPAKFIPEIPRNLLNILGVPNGGCVFDPFCGSGVTLVEAQKLGIPSVGVDLNPIACLISRVKTSPLPPDLLDVALEIIENANSLSNINVSLPDIPNVDHWFDGQIQIQITKLLNAIDLVEDSITKDYLQLALSSILVRVSRQDSDTRYAAVDKGVKAEDVIEYFRKSIRKIISNKERYAPKTWESKVVQNNIFKVKPEDLGFPIGIVITSPPYPNAYEYWLYHKYRMYWLGFDPIEVKKNEIGARAHYFKKNYPTDDEFTEQLTSLFELFNNVLLPEGYVCIVIGRSIIHGRIVDNADLTITAAMNRGYKLVENISRNIKMTRKSFNLSHANIKKENILIFSK